MVFGEVTGDRLCLLAEKKLSGRCAKSRIDKIWLAG